MLVSNIDNKGFNIYRYPWPVSLSSRSSRVDKPNWGLPSGMTDWDGACVRDSPLEYQTGPQFCLIFLIFTFTYSSTISLYLEF